MTLQQLPELAPCREKRATAAAPHRGVVIRRLVKDDSSLVKDDSSLVKDDSRRVAVGTGQFFRHRVLRSIAMQ
jgi:hypothetical protein